MSRNSVKKLPLGAFVWCPQVKAGFPEPGPMRPEFFVDIFNVLNNQDATREQHLVAGSGGIAFGQAIRFVDPRRFFLGARLNF